MEQQTPYVIGRIIGMIVFPLIFLWSINTLFPLYIEYTIMNWLAAFAFLFLIGVQTGGIKHELRDRE